MAVSFCGKRIILTRTSLLKTPKRNGYIVLLPEIGDDLPDKNPLVKEETGFPEFNSLSIEKCIAAISKQSIEFEEGVKKIEASIQKKENPDVFKEVLNPLEELGVSLDTTWGIAKTLYFGNQSLMPTKCYLGIHDRARNARAVKFNSKSIFHLCKSVRDNPDLKCTEEQRRLLSKFVLEGKLNGLELEKNPFDRFRNDGKVLNEKRSQFKARLEFATKQFKHKIIDPNTMKDFPEDFLRIIAVDPMQPQRGPWVVTLQPHIVTPFLEYCPDRELRWKVWQENNLRSSLANDKLLQTSTPLEEIRYRRNDRAKLLGYKSYVHLSMETKMAGSLETVYNVLDTLLETARPSQEEELNNLTKFAKERGFDGTLQHWDVPYWARKQRRTVYNYNEEVLKEYFSLPKVLDGLFRLSERLFGIKIVEERKVDVWHKDVRFFDIFDASGPNSEPLASFYLDPYARSDQKIRIDQDSGWMVGVRPKSTITDSKPLAALIFNFQSPIYGKPSLLTFRDVQVLFKRFGHALQHLLTVTNYSEVSGLSNIEWDAAEISSHFMANWLFEPSTIQQIGEHYDTGETLPEENIESLRLIRSHMAGYNLCRELYLSRLDLELHDSEDFWMDISTRIWNRYFVLPREKRDSHVCSFEAIFSDEWGAAYYSHIWSEMIAADIYSAFQEIPVEDQNQVREIGKRYRDTFLALGGSCSPNEVFRRFRGRDPSPKALLKNLGLKNVKQEKIN
ncbi:probable cytosolic oligopeptidase A [Cephus cinctus]|uniref:Probable cytosolic oligopeptidase A n=1 Tax=Cephus cinctus TaxID=211228 RepID=A0AAJ7C4C3_CEPCN|nr:probable cytosolic oligopeptidase A [Cephus cinctus]XP_015601632.1 probable cytosolic oligopeptidase A [Cephus cinctus]XP_015601633.1 probable cytosolic oligopeptidase A [Cephus cinctus]XP_015601635.1 probable cytosolic oligopeptidase A [Cephus cinctus]XP_024943878.1 probable cytosolic oligopeptidase A [Cephus cinctus]